MKSWAQTSARARADKGGSDEEMKSLNEAYSVLRNEETRHEYDAQRSKPAVGFVPVSSLAAQDVGLLGEGLSAFFCLLIGLFLLFLVRIQWIRFLWPLAILAVLVILFGIMMARNAMRAFSASLPLSNRFRRHTHVQEAMFWSVVIAGSYGVYLLLTAV